MTDYRTEAVLNALTSLGVVLEPWQVEALDRLMVESGEADDE
jgi:hypothetical protein